MRKLAFIFIAASIAMVSCKTSKKVNKNEEYIYNKEEVKPVTTNENVATSAANQSITVKSESVKVASGEDQSKGKFQFYVVIGSFSKVENAQVYKAQLVQKGFSPFVLQNESGLFRVSVNMTNSESEARGMISQIRKDYPEHSDVWLLKSN